MSLVRPGKPGDRSALEAIASQAHTSALDHRGGPALIESLGFVPETTGGALIDSFIAQDHQWFLGEVSEEVSGISVAWTKGSAGWLALYVVPEARQQGIGRALSQAAMGWLGDRSVTSIDAVSLPGDRQMKRLFEDLGFKARLLVMRQGG